MEHQSIPEVRQSTGERRKDSPRSDQRANSEAATAGNVHKEFCPLPERGVRPGRNTLYSGLAHRNVAAQSQADEAGPRTSRILVLQLPGKGAEGHGGHCTVE